MPPVILAVGVGLLVLVFFVGIGLLLNRQEKQIDDRVERYAGQRGREKKATGQESQGKKTGFIVQQVDKAVARKGFAAGLALSLAQADLKLTVGEFLIINFMSCLLFALLLFVIGGSVFMIPLGLAAGFFVPRIYLSMRKSGRLNAFNGQLGDTITLMANALRAGYSLVQAMEAISREMPPPISVEFARVVKEIGLGLSHEVAMNHLLERVRSDDLDLLVTVPDEWLAAHSRLEETDALGWKLAHHRLPIELLLYSASEVEARRHGVQNVIAEAFRYGRRLDPAEPLHGPG